MINDNFYSYVNKNWQQQNPLPDDKARWSQFDILYEKVLLKLKDILENKLDKNNKLFKLYKQSLENYNFIDLINNYILKIDAINNINQLLELSVDYTLLFDINFILNFCIYPDFNNSSKNILYINTSGLGLPSKEYYFLESKEDIQIEYKNFIDNYSKLFNINIDSNKIFNFEKILADKTYNSEQERDIKLTNNIQSYEKIINNYPKIEPLLNYYFKKINKNKEEINIINPIFLKLINKLLISESLDTWKQFLKYKLILSVHYFINQQISNTYADFYEKKLSGKIILEPLWKKNIQKINVLLGQELGKYFIKYNYPNSGKETNEFNNINIIIDYIFNIIKTSLENNLWLSQSTKEKAIIKMNKMNVKIGYPDKRGLYNYDLLLLNNNYFNNIIYCIQFNKKLEYEELYKNKNIYRWHMHPQTVNAYYSQSDNEFVIPAGILDEPFYFKNDIIKSFSGIGFIIGHEIIHAFDNKGRLFDENGNLKNWWTPIDNEKYIKLSNKLIFQYNNYNINGSLTLGENIADLGGIKFAVLSLILFLKKHNCKLKYSYFKTFFINYAYCLASNIREEKAKELLLTDPHSPSEYRVNGILKNINIFLKVFKINSGNMFLNIEDQIVIW